MLSSFKRYFSELPSNYHQFVRQFNGFPVIGNGVPKAGTHLLESTLKAFKSINVLGNERYIGSFTDDHVIGRREEVTNRLRSLKNYQAIVGHFSKEPFIESAMFESQARMILIVRDPRDVVISHVDHAINAGPNYRLNEFYKSVKGRDERIFYSILGVEAKYSKGSETGLPNITERFSEFTRWTESKSCIVVHFEKLIGKNGGGSDIEQLKEFSRISSFLEIGLNEKELRLQAKSIYNPKSSTFSKGIINRWKSEFNINHIAKFKEIAGDLLINLGYEETYDW